MILINQRTVLLIGSAASTLQMALQLSVLIRESRRYNDSQSKAATTFIKSKAANSHFI